MQRALCRMSSSRLACVLQRPAAAAAGARRLPRLSCGAADGDGAGGSGGADELPEALRGLEISADGKELIDTATGKVVNEFGATRFDVAVQAMRGAFDPPSFVENTERTSGLLLDSLLQFPATYEFQLVVSCQAAAAGAGDDDGASSSGSGSGGARDEQAATPAALLERYRSLIADTTAADIPAEACTAKERLGGKYVSLCIPARVQAAHVVDLVWAALADDPAVRMKY